MAELTPRAQAKLLRVLQDGEIRRLGEKRTQRLDLRVVAATNRPLEVEAAAGRFRKDLLYRLNVIGLTAPPLRLRAADVARLADHYWPAVSATAGRRATLARERVAALAAHPWPGNVRELQNVLANLSVSGAALRGHRPGRAPRRLPGERRLRPASDARRGARATGARDGTRCHEPPSECDARRQRAGYHSPSAVEADGASADRPVRSEPRPGRAGAFPIARH